MLARTTKTITATTAMIEQAVDKSKRDTALAVFCDSFNNVRRLAHADSIRRDEAFTKAAIQPSPEFFTRNLADQLIRIMYLAESMQIDVAEAVASRLSQAQK